MDHLSTEGRVRKAINNKQIIKIRLEGYDFDIILEPYIEGDDFLQKRFVWGYIPFNMVWYKFYFDFIDSIKVTNTTFVPQEKVNYYFSDEEEHYALIDSVQFWQNFGKHA
jgi:hypothetical protein